MKNMLAATTIAVVALGAAGAAAQELATFELMGFPITRHQVVVVGSAYVQEWQAPAPGLTLGGMPASPHQLAALTPRLPTEAIARLATVDTSAR